MTTEASRSEIDKLLIRQIGRWAVVLTILLALFDVAMLRSWPFPDAIEAARGAFYVIVAVALLLGTLLVTFLGYRIVTMRVATRARSVYLIFLPGVFLLSTIVGFLLLTAPR
ncbi:MAG TPA: hypothetical protein VFV93_10780 [Thermomicrobiales bacterium]|nr:hypothetical protein [Thermomicrobiales bacterium]